MKKILLMGIIVLISISVFVMSFGADEKPTAAENSKEITLPAPKNTGTMSLEEAILKRHSVRAYKSDELTSEQLSQLLWSAQGLNPRKKFMARNAPSAGGVYPMEVYVLDKAGIYQYIAKSHSLKQVKTGDTRKLLGEAAYGQSYIVQASVDIVLAGDVAKCAKHYGDRASRYVAMEVGHIGQNISLEAVALGLGTVMIGAFDDEKVNEVLSLPDNLSAFYIIPVGYSNE
ncbi:MAG: SagB/ThcOx family dehydrogenase [Candidatus Brocadiia bacterium]